MHLFEVAFFTAGTVYAVIKSQIILFYFILVVGIYILIGKLFPGAQDLSIQEKILTNMWKEPAEGIIYVKQKVCVEKVLNFIQSLPKQNRPTLTHFVIKAIGQVLHSILSLNGKYLFGKFIQYQTQDVSCIVDIDNGNDLAIVIVQDGYHKGVSDISEFIRSKAQEIKEKKGDYEHKKRMSIMKYIPTFLVSVFMHLSKFIFHYLSLSIKPLCVKENQFEAAVLTSIGMIEFEDATAPLIGVMGCTFSVTLNRARNSLVVENGQIVSRKVANINFAIDHRNFNPIKCKDLLPSLLKVFEEPEKYLKRKRIKSEMANSDHKTFT